MRPINKSINVIIATANQRPEGLRRAVASIVMQLDSEDMLTLISDPVSGFHDNVLASDFNVKCRWLYIMNSHPMGFWGHASRNKFQHKLKDFTAFQLHGDDDDEWTPNAIKIIKSKITEENSSYLHVFRMADNNGNVYPRYGDNKIRYGNIGTPCGLVPKMRSYPNWGLAYGGDHSFYAEVERIVPSVIFHNEIIYLVRPD